MNNEEQHEIIPSPLISKNENDNSRQIRYYQDRIDFHGEILMKPQAAKSRKFCFFLNDLFIFHLI